MEAQPLLLAGEDGSDDVLPRRQKRSTLLTVCPFILSNEFCERLAYYGLATNFVTYLTRVMGTDPATAAIVVLVFEGTCYVTPVLGAYLADSHWGRYKTILVFSAIYLLGMVALTLSSWLPGLAPEPGAEASALQVAVLMASLGIIALGTGGIKPNVSAFGADQFDETDAQDKAEKASFFNYFYLAINLGSLIACTAVVYVQDSVSWTLGFLIPALAMALAIVSFVAGSRRYRHVAPTESPMARVVKVVMAALHNRAVSVLAPDDSESSLHRAMYFQQHVGDSDGSANVGAPNGIAASSSGRCGSGAWHDDRMTRLGPPSKSFRWLEDAITEWHTSQGHLMLAGGVGHGYTPQQVDEVKMVLRLLPVFWTTAVYWTVYAQMGTMFIQQGSLMENRVSLPLPRGHAPLVVHIPSASMALFNTGAIIALVPLWDRVLEPLLKRFGVRLTLLRKIGWGMVVAVGAMVYGAALEAHRLAVYRAWAAGGNVGSALPAADGDGDGVRVAVSILWQAPAYVLVAASEVLASIAQLEFFYQQAPDVMRSCSMALQLVSTALGSYLGGVLVAIVQPLSAAAGHPWLPKDLNQGHLDYFLLLTGGVMAVNIAAFVWVAVSFEYKAVEHRAILKVPVVEDTAAQSLLVHAAPGRPPLAPTAPRAMVGRSAAHPTASARGGLRRPPGVVAGSQGSEEGSEADVYSRSLAYFPTSPALPAPFR